VTRYLLGNGTVLCADDQLSLRSDHDTMCVDVYNSILNEEISIDKDDAEWFLGTGRYDIRLVEIDGDRGIDGVVSSGPIDCAGR
jgi:hypothetical protein